MQTWPIARYSWWLLAIVLAAPAAAQVHADPAPLKLLVYGASGRVGSRVVGEALARGHFVTAVSREPARLRLQHERLTVAAGDVLDKASIASLAVGHDIVVLSVRGSISKSRRPEDAIQRVGVQRLVEVLRDLGDGAPRLIHVGGAGSLETSPGVLYADSLPRMMRVFMPRGLKQEIQGQLLALEYLRTVTDVDWTYISPPQHFAPGERTGEYRIGGDQMLVDSDGNSRISMEDFAVALVDEVEAAVHVGQRFTVAY